MTGERLTRGILAGLAGGIVFGGMMQMMGSIPMIASMVGSSSVFVGWVIHVIISAVFGAGYAILFSNFRQAWLGGLIYGVIAWVVGALLIMPAILGMGLFMINQMTLLSLMGHMIYGLVLGLVWGALAKSERARATAHQ